MNDCKLNELRRKATRCDDLEKQLEKARKVLPDCLRYMRHVQNWSTHGPADMSSEVLGDRIEAAISPAPKPEAEPPKEQKPAMEGGQG